MCLSIYVSQCACASKVHVFNCMSKCTCICKTILHQPNFKTFFFGFTNCLSRNLTNYVVLDLYSFCIYSLWPRMNYTVQCLQTRQYNHKHAVCSNFAVIKRLLQCRQNDRTTYHSEINSASKTLPFVFDMKKDFNIIIHLLCNNCMS